MSGTLQIALSGLQDASLRALNAAENIVKASSTVRLDEKNSAAARAAGPTDVITLSQNAGGNLLGVTTEKVPRDPAYQPAYSPDAANADENGLVAVPNVDIASEIVALTIASTVYKANAAVIRATENNDRELLKII